MSDFEESSEDIYNPSLRELIDDCTETTEQVQELLGGVPVAVSFSALVYLISETIKSFHDNNADRLDVLNYEHRKACDESLEATKALRAMMTFAWQCTVEGDISAQAKEISGTPEFDESKLDDLCDMLFNAKS